MDINVRKADAEVRRAYGYDELLILLRYHPLMMTRVTFLDCGDQKYGRGELHAELDIAANYVRAMANTNLASPCEQGLAFYLHQVLAIQASARTHLVCESVSFRGDVPIPDDREFLGIWVDIQRLDVNTRYADAYASGRVGYSRAKPLVQVRDLVVRIEV